MKKKLVGGVVGLTSLLVLGLSGVGAKAATTVINGTTVDKDYLNQATYYRTTKAVKAKIIYDRLSSGDTRQEYTKSITLPKGLVVAGNFNPKRHLANGKWRTQFVFTQERLNYALINRWAKKGYAAENAGGISYANKSFKRVKTPAYLPTWSYGDLYVGGAKAAQRDANRQVSHRKEPEKEAAAASS